MALANDPTQSLRTMMTFLLALFTVVSFSGCSSEKKPEENVDHHIYLAESYVDQGQLKAALLEAKTALQIKPDDARAIYVISKAMLVAGDANSAEKQLQELVKAKPTERKYVYSLIDAFVKLKKYHSASFELTEFEKKGGLLDETFYDLRGQVHYLLGEFNAAEQSFQQSLKTNAEYPEAYIGLAKIAHVKKQVKERDSYTKQALEISPHHVDTWLWKAALAMEGKDYPNAEKAFSNALLEMQHLDTMTATKYITLTGMVDALIAQGKTDDALRYSETLAQSPQGKLQSSYKNAVGAFQTGDFSTAEQTFQEILEQAPGHGATGTALGIIKYTQGDLVEAENYLTQALEGGGKIPAQAYKLLAITRVKLNRADEALEIVENGIKAIGEDAELYSLLGLTYIQLNKPKEARTALDKSLEISPDNTSAQLALAALNLEEKRFSGAWMMYNKVLKEDANNLAALKGVVDVSVAEGDIEKGIERIRSIIKKNPKSINPVLILSSSYLRDYKFDDAISSAIHATEIDTGNEKAKRLLATCYYAKSRHQFEKNNIPGALDAIRKAQQKAPDAIPVVLLAINLELRSGNTEQGVQLAHGFIEANPDSHQGYEILGDLLIKQSRFSEAVANYEKAWKITQNHLLGMKLFRAQYAVRQDEDAVKHLSLWRRTSDETPASLFTLGMAYQEMDEADQAIPYYETVLQKQPDHVVTLNNLAWLYQEAGIKGADKMAKKAVELAPNSASINDTYGWILVLNGNKEEGIKVLEKALELEPNNREIKQHLTDARKM